MCNTGLRAKLFLNSLIWWWHGKMVKFLIDFSGIGPSESSYESLPYPLEVPKLIKIHPKNFPSK
jgi:hypothetical protein